MLGADVPGLLLPHPYYDPLTAVPSWEELTGRAHVRYLPVEGKRTSDFYPYLPFGYPDVLLRDGTRMAWPDLPPCKVEHPMDDFLVEVLDQVLWDTAGKRLDRLGNFRATWVW